MFGRWCVDVTSPMGYSVYVISMLFKLYTSTVDNNFFDVLGEYTDLSSEY